MKNSIDFSAKLHYTECETVSGQPPDPVPVSGSQEDIQDMDDFESESARQQLRPVRNIHRSALDHFQVHTELGSVENQDPGHPHVTCRVPGPVPSTL